LNKYSKAVKINSTNVEGFKKHVTVANTIHASYNQARARTGRLSSSNPNMQNIPNDKKYGPLVRRMFVPRPGYCFVEPDYSQIELRVQAELAQDKNMCDVYDVGDDVHDVTGRWLFKIPDTGVVSKDQRRASKAVNFGTIYGMSAYAMSLLRDIIDAGYTFNDCRKFIGGFFELYPGILEWQERMKAFAYDNGRVYTMFGRWRLIENARIVVRPRYQDNGESYKRKGEADRKTINTPVQGTASDFMLVSLTAIQNKYGTTKDAPVAVVGTIHDALVAEVEIANKDIFIPDIMKIMKEEPLRWLGKHWKRVPIEVDAVWSEKNWGVCKPYVG